MTLMDCLWKDTSECSSWGLIWFCGGVAPEFYPPRHENERFVYNISPPSTYRTLGCRYTWATRRDLTPTTFLTDRNPPRSIPFPPQLLIFFLALAHQSMTPTHERDVLRQEMFQTSEQVVRSLRASLETTPSPDRRAL